METKKMRATERFENLTEALEDNNVAVADLRQEMEDLADRVQDLEEAADEAGDSDDEDSEGGAVVDALSDLHAVLLILARVTAAAAVLNHAGSYPDASFDRDQRQRAERILSSQVRWG
jgi:predicted transcriptional regulator